MSDPGAGPPWDERPAICIKAIPLMGNDRLRVGLLKGGVPREQKMLEGHLPRAIYHQVY